MTETGWPTDDERTEDTQARVPTAVADAVLASGAGLSQRRRALPRRKRDLRPQASARRLAGVREQDDDQKEAEHVEDHRSDNPGPG
jgi:hypothetical protein